MLAEQGAIADFVPMNYIPVTVRLTVFDSEQIKMGKVRFQKFIRYMGVGNILIPITHPYSFVEIADAHHFMERHTAGGKIVVAV